MNFILTPPSLEHMAAVKIAITLWSQVHVRLAMPESFLSLEKHWHELDEIVAEKVSKLPLPAILNDKLLDSTQQVGLQILSWVEFHTYDNNFVTMLPDTLVWTPHGTIDKKKTAEVLTKDETIDIKQRFLLACAYCLEDDILDLRGKFELPRNVIYHYAIPTFWSNYLKENELLYFTRVINKRTKYEQLFEEAAVMALNEVATQYFLLKLSPQNADRVKMTVVKFIAESVCYGRRFYFDEQRSNILFFLFSTLNVEQQAEIFQRYTCPVLTTLLVWPRQSLFLEIAKNKWNVLSKTCYGHLLHNIVNMMSCKCSYFKNLFLEFWQQTPQTYKKFVTDGDDIGCLLLKLYQKEGGRIIKVILKDSSISARKKIIFSDVGQDILNLLVYYKKWDSLEYLIGQCISSAEEMIEFRDKIKKKIMENNNTSSKKVCRKDIRKY